MLRPLANVFEVEPSLMLVLFLARGLLLALATGVTFRDALIWLFCGCGCCCWFRDWCWVFAADGLDWAIARRILICIQFSGQSGRICWAMKVLMNSSFLAFSSSLSWLCLIGDWEGVLDAERYKPCCSWTICKKRSRVFSDHSNFLPKTIEISWNNCIGEFFTL